MSKYILVIFASIAISFTACYLFSIIVQLMYSFGTWEWIVKFRFSLWDSAFRGLFVIVWTAISFFGGFWACVELSYYTKSRSKNNDPI